MKKGENYISWVGAYTTVMFSMIFLTVLSLVLSALEAVRVSAVRMAVSYTHLTLPTT